MSHPIGIFKNFFNEGQGGSDTLGFRHDCPVPERPLNTFHRSEAEWAILAMSPRETSNVGRPLVFNIHLRNCPHFPTLNFSRCWETESLTSKLQRSYVALPLFIIACFYGGAGRGVRSASSFPPCGRLLSFAHQGFGHCEKLVTFLISVKVLEIGLKLAP